MSVNTDRAWRENEMAIGKVNELQAECERLKAENARLTAAFQNVVAYLATEKARCKERIALCEKEGDTHGTNFHQGMFSGFNQADIAIQAKNLFYLDELLHAECERLKAELALKDSMLSMQVDDTALIEANVKLRIENDRLRPLAGERKS